MNSDRKQSRDCGVGGQGGIRRQEHWGYKGIPGGVMDVYVHCLHCNGFVGMSTSKLIQLYTLKMCSFLYANYTSIKLSKKNEESAISKPWRAAVFEVINTLVLA